MIINKQQMDAINAVQYDIFKAFHSVCESLGLTYYLVHGSLLGALRYQGFFPMDDDIDVAMPRKDYDVFMKKGQEYIDKKYFIQSHLSEIDYPLLFGKVRANDTAFIQPVLNNCNVHQGIYIDVFPIDNCPTDKLQIKLLNIKSKLYSSRVNHRLIIGQKRSVRILVTQLVWRVLMPSWSKTRDRLCSLHSVCSHIILRNYLHLILQ